jgi:riboflavin transporter FmnP
MGPGYGVAIQFIKNFLNLTKTTTGGVGELSNFIVGGMFVFVSSSLYRRKKTKSNAIKAMIIGVICMTVLATLSNAFVVFPLYGKIMGLDMNAFVGMTASTNKFVTSYFSLMVLSIAPFNLIKGGIEVFVTSVLYIKVSPILKK